MTRPLIAALMLSNLIGCGDSPECEQLAECCGVLNIDCALEQNADGCATTLDVIRSGQMARRRAVPPACIEASAPAISVRGSASR